MRIVSLANLQQFAAINLTVDPGADPGKHPIPNCVEFILNWTLSDGKQAKNILAISVSAGFSATAALAEQARAAVVAGANWTTYAAFLSTGTSLTAVSLRDMRQIDLPTVSSTGSATPGTSASAALPSEVAIVATIRTAKVGPGNRGRAFLPGFATNALAAGDVIAPAVITAANAWLTNNVNGAMTAIGGAWGVRQPSRVAYISPKTGASIPARPAGVAPVTTVSVRDNHWDTQRKRGLR